MATTAKSAVKRAPKKVSAGNSSEAQVKVSLEPSLESLPIYANHVEIGHTRHEFTFLAGRVPGKISADRFKLAQQLGTLQLEPDVTILLAPTVIPGLIRALQVQLEKWEGKFGVVNRKDGEK